MDVDESISFEANYAENGDLLSVTRRAGGQSFPIELISGENPDICEYLTWAYREGQPHTRGQLRGPCGPYFCQAEKLVEYCKEQSITLYPDQLMCNKEQFSGQNLAYGPHVTLIPSMSRGELRFCQLASAAWSVENSDANDIRLRNELSQICVSNGLEQKIIDALKSDNDCDLKRLFCVTVDRTFVYLDISRFSTDHTPGQQLLVINSLVKIANDKHFWQEVPYARDARKDCEAGLCIGDGYIFVFKDAAFAAFCAAYLANLIERLIAAEKLVEFHFRISVNAGPVYRFWDKFGGANDSHAGRWNYVGEGITEGERVLSVIGKDKDDIVYISANTRKKIRGKREDRSPYLVSNWTQNRGRLADKHKVFRGVYEINHTAWMENFCPTLDKLPPI